MEGEGFGPGTLEAKPGEVMSAARLAIDRAPTSVSGLRRIQRGKPLTTPAARDDEAEWRA